MSSTRLLLGITVSATALMLTASALRAQAPPDSGQSAAHAVKADSVSKGVVSKIEKNKVFVRKEDGKTTVVEVKNPKMFKQGDRVIIDKDTIKKDPSRRMEVKPYTSPDGKKKKAAKKLK